MIYLNNRNGSSGRTCRLIPRLISATYIADGTAHYAEKVGDTQHFVNSYSYEKVLYTHNHNDINPTVHI